MRIRFERDFRVFWYKTANCIFVVAVLAGADFIFFRLQFANHWTMLFGDRTDGAIEVAILEHWYNVFLGNSLWHTTNYFYPYSGSLGYNDGYFLYGVIYSAIRQFGVDPFLSSEMVNVIVKSIGFLGLYWAIRSIFLIPTWLCLLGATVFTVSNNSFMEAIHAQLFTVGFAPVMAAFLFHAHRACRAGMTRSGVLWCALSAFWYSAWVLTAFYTAWFFAFFCGLASLLYCVADPAALRRIWFDRTRFAVPVVVGAAILVAGLLPFVMVYLPKARETGMHPFAEALTFSPSIFDTFNVGPNNWLFGKANVWINARLRPDMPLEGPRASGLPPVLIALFVGATSWLWCTQAGRKQVLARSVAAAAAISWLLSLHFGPFTPWQWIHAYIPGAAAIRVIARYQMFLVGPVVAVVMVWLNARFTGRGRLLLPFLAILLVAEEINLGFPIGLVPATEMARLQGVPPFPKGCIVFAVTNVRPGPLAAAPEVDAVYSHNVDAMLIAEYIGHPTINGMASFVPPEWKFSAPANGDYAERVQAYVATHRIQGLCTLDLQTLSWSGPG
ncbi:hypothetical protein WKW79_35950 [Variovorax robiniae]|uniref:Glycosyltransferase RgtA/B/C/D-like domain-containing protein n=1 Tax=Variovorax robiniae TaxID=1836199 RepID=A0ABU8XMR4_9BURK